MGWRWVAPLTMPGVLVAITALTEVGEASISSVSPAAGRGGDASATVERVMVMVVAEALSPVPLGLVTT